MNLKRMDIYFEMGTKDVLVDYLLSQGHDDFYFVRCNRYSASAFLVSAQEQVSARREFGLFSLILNASKARELASRIKGALRDKSIKILASDVEEL